MVHFSTNIYAKCLALLVKHDPLCEEGHNLQEFSRYVSQNAFWNFDISSILRRPNIRKRDMVFTR